MSFEWICSESCDDVWQRGAVSSALLHPPRVQVVLIVDKAKKHGIISLTLATIFTVPKNKGTVASRARDLCSVHGLQRREQNMALFLLHMQWSGTTDTTRPGCKSYFKIKACRLLLKLKAPQVRRYVKQSYRRVQVKVHGCGKEFPHRDKKNIVCNTVCRLTVKTCHEVSYLKLMTRC